MCIWSNGWGLNKKVDAAEGGLRKKVDTQPGGFEKKVDSLPTGCLGYWTHYPDGDEFDCDYPEATMISCEDCIYGDCGGEYDPETGEWAYEGTLLGATIQLQRSLRSFWWEIKTDLKARWFCVPIHWKQFWDRLRLKCRSEGFRAFLHLILAFLAMVVYVFITVAFGD